MAKFETVAIGELKHRLPAKLRPLVEEYKSKLGKLDVDQGRKLVLEKGDGPVLRQNPVRRPTAQVLLSRAGREGWARRRPGRSRSGSWGFEVAASFPSW